MQIIIKNLEVYAFHGVLAEEKTLGQKFYIDAKFRLVPQANYDKLNQTVSYVDLCQDIKQIMLSKKYDLIEKVVQVLTEELSKKYFDDFDEIKIAIKKPSAPFDAHFDFVQTKHQVKKHQYYLSIGSNIGNGLDNINQSYQLLEHQGIKIIKKSQIVTTKPWGDVKQDDFSNSAILVEAFFEPQEVIEKIWEVEKQLKRKRDIKWGPRVIDIDIIYWSQGMFSQQINDNNRLIIPHPYRLEREFVLKPILELDEWIIDCQTKQYVKKYLQKIDKDI